MGLCVQVSGDLRLLTSLPIVLGLRQLTRPSGKRETAVPAPSNLAPRVMRFGVFEADLRAAELRKSGARIRLEGQPFQILALLLERPGEVVTREELKQQLWPADTFVDFEHSINTAVKRLREALGDSADTPRFIETLPRRGYRFIHPINGAAAELPQPIVRPRYRWLVSPLLIALPALLIGMLAVNVGGLRERFQGWGAPPITSLAVLPLKNVSGDPAQDAFAAGMTDVLITELSRISAFEVRSYQSVQQFKNSNKPMAEIARELNVQAVMEGSLAVEGDRIRLTLQLIRASPETHLWEENYTRELASAITLQNALSRDVARELRIKLTPTEKARLVRERDVNPRAYEAFTVGRYHWREGTEEGRRLAGELFQKAIQLDPGYAQPYAYLAVLYSHGGGYLAGGGIQTRMKAREWANKALELDDSSAEAHTALGWLELADWDWRGADLEFKRAIELNPNFPQARTWYAQYLSAMRRFDEAFVQAQRAIELAPQDPDLLLHAALAYYEAGRVDEAIKRWNEVVKLDPNYWGGHQFLGRAYILKGMYEEAIAELQRSAELRNPGQVPVVDLALMACAHARAGRRAETLKIVQALERRAASGKNIGGSLYGIPFAYAALGDKDKAFAWLEKGYERRGEGMFFLNSEPLYDPLRSDPRFQDLLQRIFHATEKLPAPVEANGKIPVRSPEEKRR